MAREDWSRGISTVVDVTMALLLISASIAMLAMYDSQPDRDRHDPGTAGYTAQTLASSTTQVSYDVQPAVDDMSNYEDVDGSDVDGSATTRTTHGTVTNLLADATVASLTIENGGTTASMTAAGPGFRRSVKGGAYDVLSSLDHDAQVVAIWRPYPGSDVTSRTTVGDAPPSTADVSIATLRVPSGLPEVDTGRLRTAFNRDGWTGAANVVADAIVRGYFPLEETQIALEGAGLDRKLTVYRYLKLADALGIESPHDDTGTPYATDSSRPLMQYGANASDANRQLSRALAEEVLAEDLEQAFGDAEDPAAAMAEALSVRTVTIVIRTWNTDQ